MTKNSWFPISMLVLIVAVIIGVFLKSSYMKAETRAADPVRVGTFSTICLDGVLYWEKTRQLAVYINKETLTPKRCEVAQ